MRDGSTIGLADSGTVLSGGSDPGARCRALVRLAFSVVAAETSPRPFSNTFVTRGMRIDSRVTGPGIEAGWPTADACDITDSTSTTGAGAPIAKAGGRGGRGCSARYHIRGTAITTSIAATMAKAICAQGA